SRSQQTTCSASASTAQKTRGATGGRFRRPSRMSTQETGAASSGPSSDALLAGPVCSVFAIHTRRWRESMVKLVVAYGPPADPSAFDQHYAETHAPLAQKIPNLRRFEAGR